MKVMGIDWNKNAGTEFCVIAYDPTTHRWFVCETVNMAAGEFSGQRWKEEVIRLNYKWKPDYIYADEGYGHTIIEDLKLWAHQLRGRKSRKSGMDLQTQQLTDRLVSFNFSQRIELRSPIDGTPIVKTGKEFLVENAVRVFEERRLWFPEGDRQLRKELMNYVVLRRTPSNNRPVYGPESDSIGDHRLDALMLALGGLFLENSLYSGNSMINSRPGFLSKKRLDARASDKPTDSEAAQLLDYITNAQLGGQGAELTVLQILRGGKMEEKSQSRVKARSRGAMARPEEGESVYEHFNERAKNTAGFETDREQEYQKRTNRKSRVQRRGAKRDLNTVRRGLHGRRKRRGR